MHLEAGHRLRVAAVEAFGEPENRGEHADRVPALALEVSVVLVTPFRRRLAMVAGDQRDDLDFFRLEAAEVSILDQIVGVLMVPFVTDMYADIV